MAWIKVKYGDMVVAPVSEFVCDAVSDVEDLPTTAVFGSRAIVIATGDVYMIDSAGTWTII